MASKSTQHGAKAKQRRTGNGSRASSRASSKSRPTASRSGSHRAYVIPLSIVALLVLSAWAFYPVARLQYVEERQVSRLETELKGLQDRNTELRSQVDRLKTPEGVEEVARENLGMVKEGENLVVVLDGDESIRPPVTEPDTAHIPAEESSMWQRALDAVFGLD